MISVAPATDTGTRWIGKRAPRFGAWMVILCTAIFVLFVAGGYFGLTSFSSRVAVQLLAIGILGVWLAGAILLPEWRPTTPLLLPVLAASIAYTVSAVFSERPRLSLEPTIGGLGFALSFLFLSRLLSDAWFRTRVAGLIIASVAAVSVAYVVQVAAEWITWWGLIGKLSAPPLRPSWAGLLFGSPNVVAAFLLIAAPLALVLLHGLTTRRWPVLLMGSVALLATGLTGSRGAYLGLLLGFAASVGLLLTRDRRRRIQRTLLTIGRHPAALLLGVAALGASILLVPTVLHRFDQGGESVRIDLWRSALDVFAHHPITGSGPGTWVQLKVLANPEGTPNAIFSNAHNMYVQTVAELGVLGLCTLAWMAVAINRRLIAARRIGHREISLQSTAVTASLVAFGGQAIFDTLVNLPVVCLLLVGVVAWVDSSAPRPGGSVAVHPTRPRMRLSRGSALPALGLLGVLGLAPVLMRVDYAWTEESSGNEAAFAGDWHAALDHYIAAQQADPEFTLYALQVASAYARTGQPLAARELLASAVDRDPVAVNQIGLAALDASLGETSAAMVRARRAVELGFGEPIVALNAGLIGEMAGDLQFAREQFANAIAWEPAIAGSEFWNSRSRKVAKDVLIADARALSDPVLAALIQAYAGDPSAAREALQRQPASVTRETYLAVTQWLAGDSEGALGALKRILDGDPLDWVAASWASRIARQSGDEESAIRFARWALIVQGDSAPSIIFERSAIPPDLPDPSAGLPRSYPAGVYIRPTSPYLLMPQLTLIGRR